MVPRNSVLTGGRGGGLTIKWQKEGQDIVRWYGTGGNHLWSSTMSDNRPCVYYGGPKEVGPYVVDENNEVYITGDPS